MRLFPRIFSYLPFDYSAEKGMYAFIHWRFTLSSIWKSICTFTSLAHNFLSSRLPCSKTILKKFYQSLNPLRKSNDPLNYLESFPHVCDASNKSLNINFFKPFYYQLTKVVFTQLHQFLIVQFLQIFTTQKILKSNI